MNIVVAFARLVVSVLSEGYLLGVYFFVGLRPGLDWSQEEALREPDPEVSAVGGLQGDGCDE